MLNLSLFEEPTFSNRSPIHIFNLTGSFNNTYRYVVLFKNLSGISRLGFLRFFEAHKS